MLWEFSFAFATAVVYPGTLHTNVTRKTYKSTYGKWQKNRDVSSVL